MNVSSTTIDRILYDNNLKKVNFIKLDIEGAELMALKGGLLSLKKYKPGIVVECGRTEEFTKIYDFLKKLNYKAYLMNNKGDLKKINLLISPQSNIFFFN